MCVHWHFAEHFSELCYRFFSKSKIILNESKDKHHVTTILTCPIFYKKQRFLKTEKTSYTPQFLFYILRNIL